MPLKLNFDNQGDDGVSMETSLMGQEGKEKENAATILSVILSVSLKKKQDLGT